MTFDQGQSPRLGQALAPEQPGVQIVELVTLPEVAFRGQIVYLQDENQFAVFNGTAWQWPGSGEAGDGGVQTFVQSTTPTADNLGDMWLNTITFQLSVWNGSAWIVTVDPDNMRKKYQTAQDFYAATTGTISHTFSIFVQTSTPTANAADDLWFNPATNVTQRWSGSAWVSVASGIANATAAMVPYCATATDSFVSIWYQTTAPSSPGASSEGNLWRNTTLGVLYRWNGGAWVSVPEGLAMATGAIGIDQIDSSQLKADAITAKHTLTGPTIQTSATAARGIKIVGNVLTCYDTVGATTLTINGVTGAVTMSGGVVAGGNIVGSTLTGTDINGANITGSVFRTDVVGQPRVEIADSTIAGNPGSIAYYGSSNVYMGSLYGFNNGVVMYSGYECRMTAPIVGIYGSTITNFGPVTITASADIGTTCSVGTNLTVGNNATISNALIVNNRTNSTDVFVTGVPQVAGGGAVFMNTNGRLFLHPPSAKKYKKNIHPLVADPQLLLQLEPVTYDYKVDAYPAAREDAESGYQNIGFIADQADELGLEELVVRKDGEVDNFNYNRLPILQQVVIRDQERRIVSLEADVAELKAAVAALTANGD